MLIKPAPDVRSSEITDKSLYVNRRDFLRTAGGAAAAVATGAGVVGAGAVLEAAQPAPHGRKFDNVQKSQFSLTDEKWNTWEQITTYNNFYEFGTDKESPSLYAKNLKTEPWKVVIEGECAKPAAYQLEDLLKGMTLEERVYRLRCVEAWSMVIPWVGFPLSEVLKKAEPTGKAKFVQFETLVDSTSMVGVRQPVLRWPYTEGLRMDEAMHPLAIIAVGLYGEVMPKQDGAPLRLVIPWKYGFKNIKSIVRIKFTEKQPLNTWQEMQPSEYGFYSNVNPSVDHPRWTQASERRIGEFFRRKTLMFNGYAEQVASLYNGMDLKKYY
ncbi:MAG: protein-methionine-sulfoxide reductase catalytic subunit MsrP [Vicinamibacterales bacterium]